jgi:hypothetical protein
MRQVLVFTIIVGFIVLQPLKAQDFHLMEASVEGNDTIPMATLKPVEISGNMGEKGKEKRALYAELIRDVKVTLPYARFFAEKMRKLDSTLKTFDDKSKRKAYLEKQEQKLKEDLKSELKDLTYDQGRVLIKLISRETDKTTYDLIKRYKSGLKATMWQTAARVFSMNLKTSYNKQEEEALERILKALERRDVKLEKVRVN